MSDTLDPRPLLENCPYCGSGDPEYIEHAPGTPIWHAVRCSNCDLRSPSAPDPESAGQTWNNIARVFMALIDLEKNVSLTIYRTPALAMSIDYARDVIEWIQS